MNALLLLPVAAVALTGCEQQMARMPRHAPYQSAPRETVKGTIAREDSLAPRPDRMPMAVDLPLLQRGQERFDIFCSPCHGRLGDGDGMVARRGFPHPPSFHQAALRGAPDTHFYDVISNGYGAMYSYASRVPPSDRWAIVAYIRALQYSQYAPAATLPDDLRKQLAASK